MTEKKERYGRWRLRTWCCRVVVAILVIDGGARGESLWGWAIVWTITFTPSMPGCHRHAYPQPRSTAFDIDTARYLRHRRD